MIRQKSFPEQGACLYLVATPIGNQQELTPRAKEILSSVDIVAAEDTRHTKGLLQVHGIDAHLISHHEHNQNASIEVILSLLEEGKKVAVVSDAGYPLISDPGAALVRTVIEKGYCVIPVSGANAATNALVASGLDTQHYLYYGFLNSKSSKRKSELETLKEFPYTMIFYEAPHRIEDMLEDLLEVLGNRKICLARELTKLHEEFIRGDIQEVLEICDSLKGEMVVVVDGNKEEKEIDWDLITEEVLLLSKDMPTNKAIKKIAKEKGVSKNELYQRVLDTKQ